MLRTISQNKRHGTVYTIAVLYCPTNLSSTQCYLAAILHFKQHHSMLASACVTPQLILQHYVKRYDLPIFRTLHPIVMTYHLSITRPAQHYSITSSLALPYSHLAILPSPHPYLPISASHRPPVRDLGPPPRATFPADSPEMGLSPSSGETPRPPGWFLASSSPVPRWLHASFTLAHR